MTNTTNGICSAPIASITSKPGGAGHLDVEEHEIGTQPLNRVDRLEAVGGFADQLEPILGREQHPQPLARQRLVVGDQRADARRLSPRVMRLAA